MAAADYRLCDVCGGKAFYDSNLNYRQGERQADKTWVFPTPEESFRVAGAVETYSTALDYLGDWAVICLDCAKTHKTQIVPIQSAESGKDGER